MAENSETQSRKHERLKGVALVRQGRLKEAISHYSEAVRIKPDFAEAYINLGIAYFGQGDVDKAISQFRCAISLAPRNSEAHYNLGIAYGSKGLFDKAFQEIRKSKELSSKGKWDLIRKEMKTTPSQHAPH
jgi:Flp pilus assembly protein TadD